MKTYSRAVWEEAQAAWEAGEFSDEWKQVRHEAAMKGMLFPPSGSKWDSWGDDDPSERAMLIRALRETPNVLNRAIQARSSWAGVVAYVVRQRDDWSAEQERIARSEPAEESPDSREATVILKRVLDRIGNS